MECPFGPKHKLAIYLERRSRSKTPPNAQRRFPLGGVAAAVFLLLVSLTVGGSYGYRRLKNPPVLDRETSLSLYKKKWVHDRTAYISFLKKHRDRSPVPLHFHTVSLKDRKGLWTVRKTYELKSVHSIIGCNPYLERPVAAIGWEIVVPGRDGVLHIASEGETIASVAKLYHVEKTERLAELNEHFFGRLEENQIVFIPWGRLQPEMMTDNLAETYALKFLAGPLGPRGVSSSFGMRRHPIFKKNRMHNGIDIPAPSGTPVHASAAGRIVFKGVMRGYGRTVRIRHKYGLSTNYAHLRSYPRSLKVGSHVSKHQIIGYVGNTGWSTGPHLDFSVRKNGRPVNPYKYLSW